MADKMLGVLAANGTRRAMVVYGDDGLDELSTTGPSTVHELLVSDDGRYETSKYRVDPAELGLAPATIEDLRGGDAAFNAEAIRQVIGGEPSPHRDIAVLNAAAALMVIGRAPDLPAGMSAGLRGDRRRPGRLRARGADPGVPARFGRRTWFIEPLDEPPDSDQADRVGAESSRSVRSHARDSSAASGCGPTAWRFPDRGPTSRIRTRSELAAEPLGDDASLVVLVAVVGIVTGGGRLPSIAESPTSSPSSSSTVPSPSTARTTRPAARSDSTRAVPGDQMAQPLGLVSDDGRLLVPLLSGEMGHLVDHRQQELGRIPGQFFVVQVGLRRRRRPVARRAAVRARWVEPSVEVPLLLLPLSG